MNSIKHVGILNAYDARNRGDRAIVQAQLGWIERTIPGASVTIFSPHHEYNQTVFPFVSCQSPLFSISKRDNFIGRLTKPLIDLAMHRLGTRTDSSFAAFHSCDAFLICGGGYLYSSPSPLASRQIFLHAANILAALKTGKPVLAFPMSWGPIRKKADEFICKRLASALPILVNRGHESNELLASWGFGSKCVMLPDVVVAASVLLQELKVWRLAPRQTGSLGIAPIDWGFDRKIGSKELENYISKLVTLGKEWCRNEGRSIKVFPQVVVDGTDDDRVVARRLFAALQDAGLPAQIVEDMEWSAYWQEIAAQEMFLGCRMHSCIFAMVCGVPTVGLGYQPKFRELFAQLGWADRSHIIDNFSPIVVADQLKNLSTVCDRQELMKHIDHVGQGIVDAMDKAWRHTLEACSPISMPETPHSEAATIISVVTPSFRQVDFLKCCAASVRDQEGDFRVEHLIQDGGSGPEFTQWAASQSHADWVSEPDSGMYDAINRSFHKATGDIIAWLNCDEQYLPGALQQVARFFENHPEIDILFGDVILVDEKMTPLAYRRAVMPTVQHIRHSHLSTFSAATFVRRRVLDEGHFLDTRWQTIADAVWIEMLLNASYRAATLRKPLAAFCMLGTNLGQSALLFEERHQWEKELGATNRFDKRYHIAAYRLHRLLVGAYLPRKVEVHAHRLGAQHRSTQEKWVSGQWRVAVNDAADLRSQRDGSLGGLMIQIRPLRWVLIHAVWFSSMAIALDKITAGDAVKGPFVLLFSLLFLSFRSRFQHLIPVAILYCLTSLYLLSERPPDIMAIRMGTFILGSILAIFWSASLRNMESWVQSTVSLIRKLPEPIILTSSSGKIVLVNQSASNLLRINEEILMGRQLFPLALGDGDRVTEKLYIDNWGERPPDSPVGLALEEDESPPIKSMVFMVGKGRYRFYVFTLNPLLEGPGLPD